MFIIKTKDYEEMCERAGQIIWALTLLKKDSLLGLATGETPLGIYEFLIDKYEKGEADYSKLKSVNLDEYLGLGEDHPQSYRYFMNKNLFSKINIDKNNTYLPEGKTEDPQKECIAYEKLLRDLGRRDLQLLGLGRNGHIGFNEPGNTFEERTHITELDEKTILDNSRFFNNIEEVPTRAITMGVGSIMDAKTILLCASGPNKAQAIKEVLKGPISPQVPGSILQKHDNLIVVADAEALSLV